MSTPAQLIADLRVLQRHYAKAAERKARILAQMEGQTTGSWACPARIPLVVGSMYFVRLKWGNGCNSPASLWKWTSRGWEPVYGIDHKPGPSDRLQVLVPKTSATDTTRRQPKGRKS